MSFSFNELPFIRIISKLRLKYYKIKFMIVSCFKKSKQFYGIKFITTFLLFFLLITFYICDKIFCNKNYKPFIEEYKIQEMFNVSITNKNILIFEPYHYHYECTPGYTKYFMDLGYNVDILMHENGRDSLCLLEKKERIRIFVYKSLNQIYYFLKSLIFYMNYYSFIVIESTTFLKNKTISDLGLLKNNKSIYVLHSTLTYKLMNFSNIENQNRIWTLGHFYIGLQVNPHYFGNIKFKDKNKTTRFFIVSTAGRNYNYIISAAKKIMHEKLEFKINVVGHQRTFTSQNKKNFIHEHNDNLKNIIIYNYKSNYSTLYKLVDSADYIIINLDPDRDHEFKNEKISGSAQLSYGFLKPALLNNYYKENYNMTSENSFLFDKNNFYNVMKKAILLSNKEYKKMQKNLLKLTMKIYKVSLLNIKKTLNSLKNKF